MTYPMVGLLEHVFNVEEWDEMGRTEVFGEDARVELIEGRIVDMNPIGDWHASCVGRLNRTFVLLLQDSAIVSPQNPVRLSEHSELQPDLAILRYRDDFYRAALPGPADTLLVVEVADTSLERDRIKALYYARAGIAQYWIVDLNGERVIEFTDPTEDGYRNEREARTDEQLTVNALPQISLTVAQIIG
ncbi:MAG: Uma2 family endonuclease [Acidimicrobiales bacterium]